MSFMRAKPYINIVSEVTWIWAHYFQLALEYWCHILHHSLFVVVSLMFWFKDNTNCFKFLLAEYWGLEHCLISADPCHFTCETSREAIQRSDYLQIHTDVVPLRSTTHRAAATMFKHGLFQCFLSMEKMH